MPDAVKELYTYNPAKAKQLLAEAGYPNGFTFKVQTSSASVEGDLLQMVAAYLAKVGVKMEIQVLDYGAYFSAMMTQHQCAGLFHVPGQHQPDHGAAQELRQGPGLEPVAVQRPRDRQEDGRGATPRATSACAR